MKLTISLDAETARALRERAAEERQTADRYLAELIHEDRSRRRDELASEGYRLLSADTESFAAAALPVAAEVWPEWDREGPGVTEISLTSHGLLPGKLPPDLLAALLADARSDDPRVLVGPRVGVDAAVLDFGERLLVVKSDPITFATEEIGWYCVQVNANDLAVMGAAPRWFLATLLLPEGIAEVEVHGIFTSLRQACAELGVSLVGGHTEITSGLARPIVCGQMLGEVERDRLVRSDGARPGDRLLLTKAIPLEATAILARERRSELLARGWSPESLDDAATVLHDPGISIVCEALLAASLRAVTAMHDPTEGGLATGLRELALAAGVGLRVEADRIPVDPRGAALCAAFGLDPLGAIASGSLLLAVLPERAAELLAAYAHEGIPCAEIGEAVPAEEGLVLIDAAGERELPTFERDEIARLWAVTAHALDGQQ